MTEYVSLGSDGFWYINPFKNIMSSTGHDNISTLRKLGDNIRSELEKSKSRGNGVNAKYQWLATLYNQSLDEYNKDYSDVFKGIKK